MKLRLLLSVALVLGTGIGFAADWPQWRGPDRSGVSSETGLLKTFPAGGPKLLWTFDQAGLGYSGPAIVGDRLYCAGAEADGDKEFVFCVNTTTGQQIWRTPFPKQSDSTRVMAQFGGGPRATPTVDGDALYLLGVYGDLVCLETASGRVRWQKNLVKDLGGRVMANWGWCESPLVDGDKLICCPGHENGTVAALDKKTGEVAWRSKDLTDDASYSSIVPATTGGVKQYILMTADGCAGVAAADGKLLWKSEIGKNGTGVIPTPVIVGDLAYITSDYGSGCGALKLSADGTGGVKAEKLFSNRSMQNHHGGVIAVGGHIYGSNGSAFRKTTLPFICQDLKSGSVVWQEGKLEPSSIVGADGHIYCYGQSTGAVVCIQASDKGFKESGRFTIAKTSRKRKAQGGIWTHPVIANGKIYLRDQELLFCYDLGAAQAEK